MAEKGPMILRTGREAANLTRTQLSSRLECISLDTIKRWEFGESKPTPDDVDRIGEIVGDPTLWHRWMLAEEPSYAKRYSGAEPLALPVSVLRVRHALADVLKYQDAIERDALDGKLDDQRTRDAYMFCLQAAVAKAADVIQQL